jgi:Protein of unknown function (DUF3182)
MQRVKDPASNGHASTGDGDARNAALGVAFYRCDEGTGLLGHDCHTKIAVSRMVADLLDRPFTGVYDRGRHPGSALYLVPGETLSDEAELNSLGIHDRSSFFGGAVPWAFVGTKVISHPTISRPSHHPIGWNPQLAPMLKSAVLPGYSVFSQADARNAGLALLTDGAVRIKSATGVGGSGQSVARDLAALEAQLAAIDAIDLARHGWVMERNLEQVSTFSVGHVQIGPWTASYVGTQCNTTNHHGDQVYGGSVLNVVRGDLTHLLAGSLSARERRAAELAIRYHDAVHIAYPGMFASRVNYDVVHGTDEHGDLLCGVLEQSWRIGGASGAELAALQAFKKDSSLQKVQTAIREIYHDGRLVPPTDCTILYDETDPVAGRLTKYVEVVPYVYP